MRKVSFQSYCKLNGAQPSNLTDRSAEIGRHPRSSLPLPYFGRLNKLIERTQYSPSRRASRDEPRFSQKSDCYYRRLKWVWKGTARELVRRGTSLVLAARRDLLLIGAGMRGGWWRRTHCSYRCQLPERCGRAGASCHFRIRLSTSG